MRDSTLFSPLTLKFVPLDTKNRNQTLHDVGYTFAEFICSKILEKSTSDFAVISISMRALIEKL